MNKRIILTITAVLLVCAALTACAQTVQILTPGVTYDVESAKIQAEYNGQAPQNGGSFLTVRVKGPSSALDNMQDTFFGVGKAPVAVSDGANTAECAFVSYEQSGLDVVATLVFEVPSGFAKSFTLSGEAFTPVTLTA